MPENISSAESIETDIFQPSEKVETSEVENNKEETSPETSQEKWSRIKAEIDRAADAEGYKIDEGIKEPVIALNILGINTSQSCEGHIDQGLAAPWISIEAPNEPSERFIGQKASFGKAAKKYNLSLEETERMFNADAYWEAYRECEANGETEEFKKWKNESEKLLYVMKEILIDFYSVRRVPEENKIILDSENIEAMSEGNFRIYNGGKDYNFERDLNISDQEKEALAHRQAGYRQEMKEFANFLKNKFFTEGDGYMTRMRCLAMEKLDKIKIEAVRNK